MFRRIFFLPWTGKSLIRTLCLLLCVALLFWVSSRCLDKGVEWQFSPQLFRHRTLTTYYVPYTNVALWSHSTPHDYHPLVAYWIDRYEVPINRSNPQWDTVTGWRQSERGNYGGIAKHFWYYCDCRSDEGAANWIAWSEKHHDLAVDFWPQVIRLVSKGRSENNYAKAAFLMASVSGINTRKEYDKVVEEWARKYAEK